MQIPLQILLNTTNIFQRLGKCVQKMAVTPMMLAAFTSK